jgi:hypothetical protein
VAKLSPSGGLSVEQAVWRRELSILQ